LAKFLQFPTEPLILGLGALAIGLSLLAISNSPLTIGLGHRAAFFRSGQASAGGRIDKSEIVAVAFEMESEQGAGQSAVDRLDWDIIVIDQPIALKRGLEVVLRRVEEEIFSTPKTTKTSGETCRCLFPSS
jgi:hypothetical protein